MSFFRKKPKACCVLIGSAGRIISDYDADLMREEKKCNDIVKEYILSVYGDLPFQVWVTGGVNEDDGTLEAVPMSIIRDIQINGLSKKDTGEKHQLYQRVQNFMVLWLGHDLKDVTCFTESEGYFKGMFILLCPLY